MARWTRRAQKDLQAVQGPMAEKIKAVINRLDAEPLAGKKLKGKLDGVRSVHVGRSYRVLYRLEPEGLLVLTIRPRRDAYR
ncbi:MAG: type II toxin-antitoxin system RelE family toxin [Acidimicrobiales bacterium]